jgi:hypothetical protein
MKPEKFNAPFIDFIKKNLTVSKHEFIFLSKENYDYGITKDHNTIWIKYNFLKLLKELYLADKIILHGLWKNKFILLLFLNPWLLKKSYWIIWGGDLYPLNKNSWIKKQVIKKMGYIITYIRGDYELIQKDCGAQGKYYECFMYPSNIYKENNIKLKNHTSINIQIGNSAHISNNHVLLLENLAQYRNKDIKILAPLSYGKEKYSKEVILKGKEIFEEKFQPIITFMPFDKYLKFLGDIDIAIFAHKRQQAMGNIITLLGLGKKVYMRSDITPWKLFKDIDVKVFDVENINLELLSDNDKEENKKKIKEYFSKENYLKQLKQLFES